MGAAVTTVRRAVERDVPAMAALEGSNQPKPWSEGVFRDELAAQNRVYLVAEEDGLVGFGGVMVIGGEAHITNLLVDPKGRRSGHGNSLMRGLIDAAIEQGARHLTLEVRSRNEAARSLYASFGLVPVGVRTDYYDDDDALILWAHDIDSDEYRERLEALA